MAIGKDGEKEYYRGYNALIRDISIKTNTKEDIVRRVVDGLIDVGVEYVVNTGEFRLPEFLIVRAYKHSGSKFEDNPRPRLSVRLSYKVRSLWKIRFNELNGDKTVISAHNWKKVYERFTKYHKHKS